MNQLIDRMDTCFYCNEWVYVERRNRTTNYTFNVNDGKKHRCPDYRRLEV